MTSLDQYSPSTPAPSPGPSGRSENLSGEPLPAELAFHVLGFIDDPRTLVRVAQVSKHWNRLVHDKFVWKRMYMWYGFGDCPADNVEERKITKSASTGKAKALNPITRDAFSSNYQHFKLSYMTMMNWRHGGYLLRSHRMPVVNSDMGVIGPLAINREWVVVGLANSRIYVFSAQTGVLHRTLFGHESAVRSVCLVSRGGHLAASPEEKKEPSTFSGRKNTNERIRGLNSRFTSLKINRASGRHSLEHTISAKLRVALGLDVDELTKLPPNASPGPQGDNRYASKGWGQPNALVISGGDDNVLRVWDIKSRMCIYELRGHTSTIHCIRVLDNRPIAVTSSRDTALRVWDIQRGRMLCVLEGHSSSVRCLDVCENKVVSGGHDATCRLWNIDTGECLHILRGHLYEIHCVAFDGVRIASGGLDMGVRVWDANTGQCQALLPNNFPVHHLQLSPTMLATGGSDGRIISWSLKTNTVLYRIRAHNSSITSLQFDNNFLVTSGKDGRVQLFETQTGHYVRQLSDPSESAWKVGYGKETCAVMCRRAGRTVMEIWSMRPKET